MTMSNKKDLIVRAAKKEDMGAVAALIKELALYEKAPEEAILSAEDLVRDGFNRRPSFRCLVAEEEGKILGMACYYERYSTWKGKTLFLEDLVVQESARRKGAGKALFETLRTLAKEGGYKRLEWQVLDWNEPAIAFYKKIEGCGLDETWINCRIEFS
mgnify:CR=1 FL=1